MNPKDHNTDRGFYIRWIWITFLGWFVGFAAIVVLSLAWDVVGGGSAQSMIGIGMGLGVGYTQALEMRPWVKSIGHWILASAVGMGAPFVLYDMVHAAGSEFPYSLPFAVAIGGLLVGLLQTYVLAPLSSRAVSWIPASLAGWTLAAATTIVGDALPRLVQGIGGALLYIALILFGGAVLGVVTGGALVWIRRGRDPVSGN